MKSNVLKLVFFLFFCSFVGGYAQVKLKSCGLDLTIPSFKQDSAFSEKDHVLLKTGVLLPIEKSGAAIEIRLFSFPYGQPGPVTVIKCNKSAFVVSKFNFYFDSHSDNSTGKGNYKNIGPLTNHPESDLFLFKDSSLALHNSSWDKFFKDLIDSNFFSLASEDQIKSKVHQKYPNIDVNGETLLCVQVKVGGKIRSMKYSIVFDKRISDVKDYQNLINIYKILNQIQ